MLKDFKPEALRKLQSASALILTLDTKGLRFDEVKFLQTSHAQ